MDAQMKKGALEMCLLHLVRREETYGYLLMKTLADAFPDVKESTVYSILRRLHTEGYVETYSGAVTNGPTRKYYRITPEGLLYLRECVGGWVELGDAIRLLGVLE